MTLDFFYSFEDIHHIALPLIRKTSTSLSAIASILISNELVELPWQNVFNQEDLISKWENKFKTKYWALTETDKIIVAIFLYKY